MNNPNGNNRPASITEAVMRLARGLRRRPPFVPMEPRVSHGAMWLLHALSSNEGISSRELAELLDMRPSSLTELLNRLEADGLIIREKDAQDMRVSHISLTEDGKKHLIDASAPWHAHDDFSDILTQEETAVFLELCGKLSNGLEKKLNEGSGHHGPAGHGFGGHGHVGHGAAGQEEWGFQPPANGAYDPGPFPAGTFGRPGGHGEFGDPGAFGAPGAHGVHAPGGCPGAPDGTGPRPPQEPDDRKDTNEEGEEF
jgi:DNA-binding MarR family transcriptional regulator